jgi:hypothetical protein
MLIRLAIVVSVFGAPWCIQAAEETEGEQHGDVAYAAVSEATVFSGKTIVNEKNIDVYEKWPQSNEVKPIVISSPQGVPTEEVADRQQIYIALRAEPVIERSGYFVLRVYLRDGIGSLEVKEAAISQADGVWRGKLMMRGAGTAGMDLMYCREPKFRKARVAFPELDIFKPMSASYFDAYPIDAGNLKEPLAWTLDEKWEEWNVPLGEPLLTTAKSVDDSLQVITEVFARFALKDLERISRIDAPLSAEALNPAAVETFIKMLQAKHGPFQFALSVAGNDVVGSSDFVPHVRKRISILDAGNVVPAELWIRSLKEYH